MEEKEGGLSKLRCCAITRAGKRCSGGWQSRVGLVFAWDPISGEGASGPDLVFCHRHAHPPDAKLRARFRIAHGGWYGHAGWAYGHANYSTYYQAVFRRQTGNELAPWYLDRSRPTRFGDCQEREAA